MSQTTFLEDVISWEDVKCQQNLDKALPKLITYFRDGNDLHHGIGILKVICSSFLPHIKLMAVEDVLFCKITDKTNDFLTQTLQNIKDTITKAADEILHDHQQLIGLLELVLDILECSDTCIKYVLDKQQPVDLESIHSLPPSVIKTLMQSYEHCKESSQIYGELLPALSEILSNLFKKTHKLQLSLLNCLDKLNVKSTEQDVTDLCTICHGLFNLCQLVPALDIKIMVSLWKSLSKLAIQYKSNLYSRLNLEEMIQYLCSDIQSGYMNLLTLAPRMSTEDNQGKELPSPQTNEKSFQKSVKICGFQMKVLVSLVKEYDAYLGDCSQCVLNLLLHLQSLAPPSLNAPLLTHQSQQDIHLQVLNATHPLVNSLISNRYFRHLLTADTDLDPSLVLAKTLLQVVVMKFIPKAPAEVQNDWFSPTVYPEDPPHQNILASIFSSLEKCYVELSLDIKVTMPAVPGNPEKKRSLYEFFCTNICGLIGSWPARHFKIVENVLLKNLLHPNFYCKILSSDVWCFIGRYGSATLCHSHVKVLAEVCQAVTWSESLSYQFIHLLFHRLFKFQSADHQEEILKLFPPAKCLNLWAGVNLSSLEENISRRLKKELVQTCAKLIHTFCTANLYDTTSFKSVVSALHCLLSLSLVLTDSAKNGCTLYHLVLQRVGLLWSLVSRLGVHYNDQPLYPLFLSLLLRLSAQLISLMNVSNIATILPLLPILLQFQSSEALQLAIADFLKETRRIEAPKISEIIQQMESNVPKTFQSLLLNSNCLIHHRAMEAFALFAQETSCETLVPQCLQVANENQEKILQDVAVAFLNKTAYSDVNYEKITYLQLQSSNINKEHQIPENNATSSEGLDQNSVKKPVTCSEDLDAQEPVKKKSKLGSTPSVWDAEYRNIVNLLQGGTRQLQEMREKNLPLPEWAVTDIQMIISQLNALL